MKRRVRTALLVLTTYAVLLLLIWLACWLAGNGHYLLTVIVFGAAYLAVAIGITAACE